MDIEKSGNCSTDKRSRSGGCKSNEPICSTVRLQRNQAEKQRRDRLNGYISELANIVPMVKNSSKPVDKVSVLRLAAAHMRLNFSCLNPKKFSSKIPALPASINSYLETTEKNIGGFIVATTFTGIVLFCSKCIEDFVGYQCIDLIGQSIYNYVDPKEVNFFEKKVNSAISRSKKEKNATKVIKLHMQQRPLPRSTEVRYRKMLFKLSVHLNDAFDDNLSQSKSPQKCKKVKHKDFGSSVVLMFVEPMKMEPKINRAYLLTHQDIYFTIHGLQGEIMYADQRIATITGYMPHDVQGTSAYQYIFDSDVPIALFAQKAMFTSNDGTGLITYRLKIFDSTYIYLQSKGQIVYKDNSTEMSHFVCYNKWLSDEEGNQELIKFQERFAPQITDSKAAEIPEKSSNNQSLPLKSPQQNDNDVFGNLKPPSKPNCGEQASTLIYSGNTSPEYEPFRKGDHLENSSNTLSTSSILSLNGCSEFKNNKLVLNGKISENYVVQSCAADLKNAMKTSTYNVDDYEQEAFQNEDNTYSSEVQLIENEAPTLPTSDSDSSSNQLCFTEKSEILNMSKSLNGMKGFSITLFQSQDIIQAESAYLPQLNSVEIANPDVESGQNCIQLPNVPPEIHNKRPLLVGELSSFTQLYSSVKEPVNGFCISKGKLPNILNANVSEKEVTELNPAIKPTINENKSIYSNELYNSKYAMPRYESNGHYNMHSSYTSPKSHSYQNFASNELESSSFAALNGAPLHINSTNYDSSPLFNASFVTSHDAPLFHNGTGFPVTNRHSPYTNWDLYSHTNGYNVSNKSSLTVNGSSHTEVQKQIITKNKQSSNSNDAYLNPMYSVPAKRIKTDAVSGNNAGNRNGDSHIFNLVDDSDHQDLFPEIDFNNEVGDLFQGIKTSSLVGESTPIQRDSGNVSFNGELYNELDMFFKQLPLSTCTPQSQLSCELAQSVDSDIPQSMLPSLSSRNALR